MRVITGKAAGCTLYALKGLDTRPTSGLVKEAVFSIINGYIPDSDVLDLFAGSGALGIEAISRGAASCDFVDSNRKAVDIIKRLRRTHFDPDLVDAFITHEHDFEKAGHR